MKLQGKSFIVTGGTRGIGQALSGALLKEGAKVAISGRDPQRLEQSLKELKGMGGQLIGQAGDVGKDSDANRLVQVTQRTFGSVDFLINNAAVLHRPQSMVDTPLRVWEETLRVNVLGTVNMIRHVLPGMEERHSGIIVNLSSGWGRVGGARVAPYSASKFAVEGLTQSVAAEVGKGLAVVALSPGVIATDMLAVAFGGDVSDYPSTEDSAPRWLRLLEQIDASWNGRSLDLDDF